MFSIKKPKLGTTMQDGWMFYHLQEMSSYILDEFFRVGIYKRLLNDARMNRNGRDVHDFKKRMQSENYHSIYSHSFIGQWSAFESGIDNNISSILGNDIQAAKSALSNFKKINYSIDDWPWDSDARLHIAQMMGRLAKSKADNSISYSSILVKQYSFLGVVVELEYEKSLKLDEANRVRNILLHRSGEVMPKDARDFGSLKKYEGELFVMNDEVFVDYYYSIIHVFGVLVKAISDRDFQKTQLS
jgi:hypothetical protein